MEKEITSESTKEEVAEFFKEKFKIKDEVYNNLIKEYITGDILVDLTDAEFKFLSIKLGPLKRIVKYRTV